MNLSPRQLAIAQLVVAARSNRQIAEQLGLVEQTVKNQLVEIYRRAGVSNRSQFIVLMLRRSAA